MSQTVSWVRSQPRVPQHPPQGSLRWAHSRSSRYLSRNTKVSTGGRERGERWPKVTQQVGDLNPYLGLGLSPDGAKNVLPLGILEDLAAG